MPDAGPNVVWNFHGEFTVGIDASKRIMMPAKWRPKDPNVVFTAILWPVSLEEFLLVLPPDRWQLMTEKLKMQKLQDKRVAAVDRVISSTSAQLTLDRVGRLALPEHLIAPLGITDRATFVARSSSFEIWQPQRRIAAAVEDKTLAASIINEIDL
jgi:MraZ protein